MKKNYYILILLFLLSKAAFAQDDPFIGEIRIYPTSNGKAQSGWLICDGSLLKINEYSQLFSVIGTIYGGDGTETFAIPDLRGRVPVGQGQGVGLLPRNLGQSYGQENTTILTENMPSHVHSNTIKIASGKPQTNAPEATSNLATSGFNSGRVTVSNVSYTTDNTNLVSNTSIIKMDSVGHSDLISLIKPMCVITYMIAISGETPVPVN